MKGNEGPKSQKLQNGAVPGADKFFVWDIGTTDRFWPMVVGAPEARPKCKEMKAHKAKMQGN